MALLGALAITTGTGLADPIPLPADASTNGPSALSAPSAYSTTAISCPSAGACSAVGTYIDRNGHHEALLLDQTAGSWRATEGDLSGLAGSATGLNLDGYVYPTAISCASPGNCSAAGFYYDAAGGSEVMTLTETGGTWSRAARAPLPTSSASTATSAVTSIACPQPGDCVAVGDFHHSNTSNDYQGYVLTQSGGSWSSQAVSLPSGAAAAPYVWLDSVSCTSVGSCVAVGQYLLSGGGQAGLLLTESGGTWSASRITPTDVSPSLVAPESMEIGDVLQNSAGGGTLACPAAGSCVAVGDYTDVHGYRQGLLLTQHGSSWSDQSVDTSELSPAVRTVGGNAAPQSQLSSVACVSAGNCTALGYYLDSSVVAEGMTVREVNGVWQPAQTAALPPDAYTHNVDVWPSALACSAAGNCAGGFQYDASSTPVVLQEALLWGKPGAWTTSELSLPASSEYETNFGWNDLACAPSGYCASLVSYPVGTMSSLAVSAAAAPAAPAVQAAAGAAGQVSVSWTAPSSGGLALGGYTVVASDMTDSAHGGQTQSVSGTTLGAVFTGLTPGDSYAFAVTATSALGTGLAGVSPAVTVQAAGGEGAPAGSDQSAKRILASLSKLLRPTGKPGRRHAILAAGGYTFTYRALEPGRVAVSWWHMTGSGRHRHRAALGLGTRRVTRPGRTTIRVRLTAAGRRLLRARAGAKLSATASFTPAGAGKLRRGGSFRLR